MALRKTYWNKTGKHQDLYVRIHPQLVPSIGESKYAAGELLRIASNVYHDMYNNGGGNVDVWYQKWESITSIWRDKIVAKLGRKGQSFFFDLKKTFKEMHDCFEKNFSYYYDSEFFELNVWQKNLERTLDAIILIVDEETKEILAA